MQPHLLRGRVLYWTCGHLILKFTLVIPLFVYWEPPCFNIKKLLQRNSLYLNPSVHKSSKLYLKLCSGTWQEIRCFCKWTRAMRLQEVTTQTSCAVVVTGHTTFSCSWKIKEEEIQAHMFQEWENIGISLSKTWRNTIRNKAILPVMYFDLDPPVLAPYQSFLIVHRLYLDLRTCFQLLSVPSPHPFSSYSPGPQKLWLVW